MSAPLVSECKSVDKWATWVCAHRGIGSRHGKKRPCLPNVRKLKILLVTFNVTGLVYGGKDNAIQHLCL